MRGASLALGRSLSGEVYVDTLPAVRGIPGGQVPQVQRVERLREFVRRRVSNQQEMIAPLNLHHKELNPPNNS